MSTIPIIYHSNAGTTALLAEAVEKGRRNVNGVNVETLRITNAEFHQARWQDNSVVPRLDASDAIVFGVPTWMGNVSSPFKTFADATASVWYERRWAGKLTGGFTISGSPSGDKLASLSYMSLFATQHGMLWMNWDEMPRQPDGAHRFGGFLGLMAQNLAPPAPRNSISPICCPQKSMVTTSASRWRDWGTKRIKQFSSRHKCFRDICVIDVTTPH